MDIILISIGSILLILFFIVTITVLFHSRRKNQRKAENARRAAAKEYYLDHPVSPLNYTFSDNNEKAKSSLEVPPILLLEQEYASKHFGIMNEEKSTIVVVSESEEMTENTSRNLNIKEQNVSGEISGPVKKANRPSKIQINNTEARAVQAKAVETDHSVKKFEVEISRILSTDYKVLLDEFEILETRDSQRERNCIAAEQNMELNRFMDILPSDDTRVILRGTKNYINASLIDGYCNSGQFIATQGPIGFEETVGRRKESTVDDFWRMVWEKNVRCIIMLTDCMENMKQRCTQYWPGELGDENKYGGISVKLVTESDDLKCIHREFNVKNDPDIRQISQYYFKNWKDTHAPDCAERLLDFIEQVMCKKYRKPIVVHCSAGVGRTGVLITLWRILEQAREEGKIDVFTTVDSIRQQRSRMVQTAEQYISLYTSLLLAIRRNRI